MARKLAFVIHNFVRTDVGLVLSPPVTLCFRRSLALQIAESVRAEAASVAVFAVDLDNPGDDPIRPFIVHGAIPERYREMDCYRLLAGRKPPPNTRWLERIASISICDGRPAPPSPRPRTRPRYRLPSRTRA